MSVSYGVAVYYGIILSPRDLETETANPDWNPEHPFDSKTGRKIPEKMIEAFDAELLAKEFGVQYFNGYHAGICFGVELKYVPDLNYHSGIFALPNLGAKEQAVKLKLSKLLERIGVKEQLEPRYILATQVG